MSIADAAKSLWARLVTAIEGEASTVDATLTELEQKLMPGYAALCKKIETTIGAQGITIIEQALGDIEAVLVSGGNIGAIIPTIIAQVTTDVSADIKQDANTAAHGALELLVAMLPTPSSNMTPTATPTPTPVPTASPTESAS